MIFFYEQQKIKLRFLSSVWSLFIQVFSAENDFDSAQTNFGIEKEKLWKCMNKCLTIESEQKR
jgi:hypothetical protein